MERVINDQVTFISIVIIVAMAAFCGCQLKRLHGIKKSVDELSQDGENGELMSLAEEYK